ncbi:MAG: PEP-CTERM sorting domain-containing protein [Planctomycetes bacterium]|nr:PEP-CTERM sorting domain-containing protein [Planctomycetota bacterium]
MRNRTIFLTFLVLIMGFAATAQANLLQNPGFEDNGGDETSADWWAGTSNAKVKADMDGPPRTGDWQMAVISWELGGTGNFYQDVTVGESTDYVYTMWARRATWGGLSGSYGMKVEWYAGVTLLGSASEDISAGLAADWQEFSLSATSAADCDSARVIIEFVGVDKVGMFDDASFLASTGVPEPATMALLGMGGLALLRRRKASSIS